MTKYRQRVQPVDAIRVDAILHAAHCDWCEYPKWVRAGIKAKVLLVKEDDNQVVLFQVGVGMVTLEPEDWLLYAEGGPFFHCRGKNFASQYERVEALAPAQPVCGKPKEPVVWTDPGGCSTCKHCGMDMDMDPYCSHPDVLKIHQYGVSINVALQKVCIGYKLREADPKREKQAGHRK